MAKCICQSSLPCTQCQSLKRFTDPFSALAPKNISKEEYPHRSLATAIRFSPDAKGKGSCLGRRVVTQRKVPAKLRMTNCILESDGSYQ
jgi:hypothetical protein